MEIKFKLIAVAALALLVGTVFAAPLLIAPNNVQPFPPVPQGPKADFSVNVVYASFNPVNWNYTRTDYDFSGNPSVDTYQAINITYNVVLNVTNLSNQPATVYQLSFGAAQDITVQQQSILGGTIYTSGNNNTSSAFPYWYFGGVVEGVYLNNNWVNETWIPNIYTDNNSTNIYADNNGTSTLVPYPENLYLIPEANYDGGIMGGPLTPDNVPAYSADHTINGTVPALPENASDTGFWFGGVPITEYYDLNGNPLITEMYINGAWVDVTGKVKVDNPQPLTNISNPLVNDVLTVGAQPYENMNSSLRRHNDIARLGRLGCWTSI